MYRALKEVVGSIDATYAKTAEDFFVGFEGSFGSKHVTARDYSVLLTCLSKRMNTDTLVYEKAGVGSSDFFSQT